MLFDTPEDEYAKPFCVRIHARIRTNVFSIPSIGFYLVLVNGPLWWDWRIGATVLIFLGLMILALGLIRMLKFWGRPKF